MSQQKEVVNCECCDVRRSVGSCDRCAKDLCDKCLAKGFCRLTIDGKHVPEKSEGIK